MKRIFIHILMYAVVLMTAGCVENVLDQSAPDDMQEANEITASLESAPTKTVLGAVSPGIYKPLWDAGDEIGVMIDGAGTPEQYTLSGGVGTSVGKFVGIGKGDTYVAYYPYSGVKSLSGKSLKVNLPSEQSYSPDSFGSGAYPMIAVSQSENMEFLNLGSVLKVSLTGNTEVGSIVFKANSTLVKVSGEATVKTDFTSVPSMSMSSLASGEVVLQCGGVALDPVEAVDFHIVVPAQTYKGGFTLRIMGPEGKMEVSVKEDIVMERSQLRAVPAFAFEPESLVKPSTTLQGRGTDTDPFLIGSLADLLLLRDMSNIEGGSINGVAVETAFFRQTADISLAQVCGKNVGNWRPIADYARTETVLKGCYDGDSHVISDLYIKSENSYQGLFGGHDGVIRDLKVSGTVAGSDHVGLLAGLVDAMEGIIAEGDVTGKNYVGGIAGEAYSAWSCASGVEVSGDNSVGGIAGLINLILADSSSNAEVNGESYVGGIAGNQNYGLVFNNVNYGNVNGDDTVGGITGFSRQSGKIYNNLNYGDISGNINVGGITGLCSIESVMDDPTTVANCINLGTVSSDNPESAGSICGYNECSVINNYWLYDPDKGLGMEIGVNDADGAFSDSYPLTESLLKGESSTVPFYVSGDDSYYEIADALTAWAADNSGDALWMSMILNGWRYSASTGYPELTDEAAVKPDGGLGLEPVFEIKPSRVEVGSYTSSFKVEVRTNMVYSVSSMPEWITEKNVKKAATGFIHTFEAVRNTESVSREGTIVFCNEKQNCVPVTVVQDEAGVIGDEWMTKDFFHRSLAMRFTADWCGYCPIMATTIEMAKAAMPDKIEAVSMHGSGGLGFSSASVFETRFDIEGYPSLIVDSRALVQNYESSYAKELIGKVINETEDAYPAKTGIAFTSSLEGSQLDVDVSLFVKEAGDYKVTVLLLEDEITGYQNGQGDAYEHNDVVRLALSDVAGDPVSVDADNTVMTLSFTGTVPAVCNLSNLRVLVYVEKPYGSQSVVKGVRDAVYGSYGDTYVDNCRSEKVGVEALLQYADDPDLGKLYESSDFSEDGKVVTLQTASVGNGIDVVLMGDAFTDRLIADGTYDDMMNVIYSNFFKVEPYKTFKNMFNVYYVKVVSKNDVYGGETALEGEFGEGTHVGGNDQTCFEYALKAITDDRMDDAMIIVAMNSDAYAGTCYMYYPSSDSGTYGSGTSVSYFPRGGDEETFAQLLHHEANGHGFSKLADEYAYEDMGTVPTQEVTDTKTQQTNIGWWKNVDFTSDVSAVRWSYFINDTRYTNEHLGCYEGGMTYWTGVWRPTENSIMRHNTGGFNAPSREAIYYRIHKLAYGSSWEYDYEEFVEYDAVNRSAAATAARSRQTNYVEQPFVPTAPPVVMKKSWRD